MKRLQFAVEIQASKERVWETLWRDESFRDWAGLIDPGTYMLGGLKVGHEIQFISSANGYGVTSLVAELVPGELLWLKHRADTQLGGKREREPEWTGGEECYNLEDAGGGATTLTVAVDVPPQLEAYFQLNYPKALARVKALAERA